MMKEKDPTADADIRTTIMEAIKALPAEDLRALLVQSGVAPTTIGMTPEMLQTLLGTLGTTSTAAMREAYRQQRKENPNYPERSVFNPAGVFDDEGRALPAKVRLSRPTFFVKVRLNDELMTPDEIDLCNSIASNKEARNGAWLAAVIRKPGGQEELRILDDFTVYNADDRSDLPPLTFILRELRDGADAVNPATMAKRIADLEEKLKQLDRGPAVAV